jgi:hypothetical protein
MGSQAVRDPSEKRRDPNALEYSRPLIIPLGRHRVQRMAALRRCDRLAEGLHTTARRHAGLGAVSQAQKFKIESSTKLDRELFPEEQESLERYRPLGVILGLILRLDMNDDL